MTDTFVALDGEMTGSHGPLAFKRYQLCQIGLAFLDDMGEVNWLLSTIGYDHVEQEPEAMAVHGITEAQIKAAARAPEVDQLLVKWLDEHGIQTIIPVGWNVGQFDMPFVREYLPNFARRVRMRSVDLNGVAFTLSELIGVSVNSVKAAAKRHAEQKIQRYTSLITPEQWKAHNAGFDAMVALYSWEYFKKILVVREVHGHL